VTEALRLPGSVAEVEASPQGPRVGAFFDLDGTLVAGFTVAALTRDRLRRREVGAAELLSMMQLAVEYRLGRQQFENIIEGAVRAARGRLAEDVEEMGERVFRQAVADQIYPEMRELVRAHQQRGHTVVLSSSALTMQVLPVARYLGIEHVVCNRFVVDEAGMLTGDLERPVVWGRTKATGVQRFAAQRGIDLRSSYFYADGDEDIGLMYLVGNPRPVNPGPAMSKVAARRGWPVLRFSSRDAGSPVSAIRTLAGLGSLGPLAAGALGVGVLARSKRAGVNFLSRYWPEALLTLNGVRLNVTGAANLTARRPAVFLFNHRNNFDVFMVAALVRDDWTAVGKIELERNPLVGPLGKLLDVAFIDRADSAAAVTALPGVEEAARKGLSILVAPEGTRMDAQIAGPLEVGPFKKGAFRIAMATGLPIVPIVIRNSESVAGRNSYRLSPGTVDIAVLPPVSVDDWTLADLPERIEHVRALYLKTLADWPAGSPAADGPAGSPAAGGPAAGGPAADGPAGTSP
jgi:putative phosphoserine phosphatase/1-acylglycerol-3-phosphate O-acyltransferase